jgi:hypothetical protein
MALASNAHLNWHPFVGFCFHDYFGQPPLMAPMLWGFLDFGVVNGVTGLFAWPTANFPFPPGLRSERGEILDMGVPMEGRGTDATFFVPHIPWAFNFNWMWLLIFTFGSSKIIMGSNKTRIWSKQISPMSGEAEQAVGCCMIPGAPLSFNLQCWDVKSKKVLAGAPIGAPMLSDIVIAPNTVQVGINFADYLLAMVDWAIDVLLALAIAGGTKKGKQLWKDHSAAKVAKAGEKAATKAEKEAAEKGLSKELQQDAAKAARKAAEEAAEKPGTLSRLYHKIGDTRYGDAYLVGIVVKLPHKLLIKNSEWYREGVQRPLEEKLPDVEL